MSSAYGRGPLAAPQPKIGFVFQFHHLLPEFTAEENVMLPLLIAREGRERRAAGLAGFSGPSASWNARRPRTGGPSGGEQQRVAVARALAARPDIVLADEPSGNLDDRTSEELHRLLWSIRDEHGQAFVIVTHDEHLADRADRKLRMHDGRLHEEPPRTAPREETVP